MLLRFEVSNHRSILEPVELSMIALDEDRPQARASEALTKRVLALAGIYGPNASGKSNLVDALVWLAAAVDGSARDPAAGTGRQPFRFGSGPTTPSSFEVELLVEGVRCAYSLTVDDSVVLSESLWSFPERRKRVVFEREGADLRVRRGLGDLVGVEERLNPAIPVLSAALGLEGTEVQPVARALAGIRAFGARHTPERNPQPELDPDPSATWRSTQALLRFAGLGIEGMRVGEDGKLRLTHRAGGQELDFELAEESAGTRRWLALIGPILAAIRQGRILVIDEIEADLHPRLSAQLLELFQDPETNPQGAQLIFTSHDTSLLGVLNRDEVWLTERDGNGATLLTALADHGGDRVRRTTNLEKAYLEGRYGAVPELDRAFLREALGEASAGP